MISSINCEKKDLFDYYMMNGIDVSIWVLSANDLDNKGKIEMLSWKSYASLMNSIIVTMHLSKNKLKAKADISIPIENINNLLPKFFFDKLSIKLLISALLINFIPITYFIRITN